MRMESDKRKILTAKDLSKTFSNGSVQQHVLKNLNLSIYKGDFTVIMGNSGSGKSTLLYALSGMDRPSMGTITYYTDKLNGDNKEIEETEISTFNNDKLAMFRRDHVGFVFQQNYLNDSMSALDNVMVCGLLKATDRKALAEKAKRLLHNVEIEEQDYRKFPTQLSGGQQQRIAVVRGVINSPEVLFADEPTGALDSKSSDELLDLFAEVNRMGHTILMVTHSTRAASRASRVMFIRDGVVFHQIYRGDATDQQMYQKISDALTLLAQDGDGR